MSAHGLHHFLWTDGATVFDVFHSISPWISCITVAMETPASPVSGPCRAPRGPLSWWVFDGSESLTCLVYLPPQLVSEQQESRPLLSPSIDDFLCETKCDGLSRPVTSNTAGTVKPGFPNSLSSQEQVLQGPFEASWARTLQTVPIPTLCRKVSSTAILVSTWMRPWSLDFFPSAPETCLHTMACQD